MFEDFLNYAELNPEVVAAISAIITSLVAFISILLSLYGLYSQRVHNRATVLPIAIIGYWDYNREIVVRVRNGGIGPMTINALTIKSSNDEFVSNTIQEHLKRQGYDYEYTHYSGNAKGRVLNPTETSTLLKITGDPDDIEFALMRDNIRHVLRTLSIKVDYSDIYGKKIGTTERSLGWFGRHFDEDNSADEEK